MPIPDYSTIQMDQWLQGMSWTVTNDISDGGNPRGIQKNALKSGHRKILASVSVRCRGVQLMVLESFLIADLNFCSAKFLADYIDGSGIKNGVVKMVDGYTVNTDGLNHTVDFTLELPSYPSRSDISGLVMEDSRKSDQYWIDGQDMRYIPTSGQTWNDYWVFPLATSDDVSLNASSNSFWDGFKPPHVNLWFLNLDPVATTFDYEFKIFGQIENSFGEVLLGGGSGTMDFQFDFDDLNIKLDWPKGGNVDTRMGRIQITTSVPNLGFALIYVNFE